MPDTPFKAMGREPGDRAEALRRFSEDIARSVDNLDAVEIGRTRCDRCGYWLPFGAWPWCKGSPEDHRRD